MDNIKNTRKKGTARVRFLEEIDKISQLYASGYCEKDIQRLSGLEEHMSYQTFRYNLKKFIKFEGSHKQKLIKDIDTTFKESKIARDLTRKILEIYELVYLSKKEIHEIKKMLTPPRKKKKDAVSAK